MTLREITDEGGAFVVTVLPHRPDFDRVWLGFTRGQRERMEAEINRRLDGLITSPNPNWGAITNTSLEGGKTNPDSGIRGDWTGTPFQPLYDHFGDDQLAGMFYGNVWKMIIIDRPELWIGIRSDPTFPQRGITLEGKTYFLAAA